MNGNVISDQMFCILNSVFQREEDFARNKAIKEEKKKAKEERLKDTKKLDVEQEEEKEEKEELPPIYIPDPPSPLCCGFYSQPGHFWLSMVCIQTQTYTPIICLFLRVIQEYDTKFLHPQK